MKGKKKEQQQHRGRIWIIRSNIYETEIKTAESLERDAIY